MAWLRESGSASSIESWSTMGAMRSGPRMIIENSLVGSSKSNGIRTMRSAIEEKVGGEDRCGTFRVAVDLRGNMIIVNEVRSRL